jgi:hypothetical protein
MSLTSKELLDVLDIVRNEELYTKRVTDYRQAEAALASVKLIAATVYEANDMKAEAEALRKEAQASKFLIEEEMRAAKKKQDAAMAEERLKLESQARANRAVLADAQNKLQTAKDVEASTKELLVTVDRLQNEVRIKNDEVSRLQTSINNKLSQMNQIWEKGV